MLPPTLPAERTLRSGQDSHDEHDSGQQTKRYASLRAPAVRLRALAPVLSRTGIPRRLEEAHSHHGPIFQMMSALMASIVR